MKVYVTYGFGSNLANCYSMVEGEDVSACYAEIDRVTDGKYAFVYDEENFKDQPEKYGLTEVPLQQQVKL